MKLKIIAIQNDTRWLTSANGDKWDVDTLPDAPTVAENATVEKRVIELPDNMIKELEALRKHDSMIASFVRRGLDIVGNYWPNLGRYLPTASNTLAEWYLHPELVEFVPKKEPKYQYRMIGFNDIYITDDKKGALILTSNLHSEYQLFTRREIEKLASEKGFKLSAFKEIEVEE
jgi:hypothetical protein